MIEPRLNEEGATLLFTFNEKAASAGLNRLGFYDFMSLGSHHQAHHYQMAIGNSH